MRNDVTDQVRSLCKTRRRWRMIRVWLAIVYVIMTGFAVASLSRDESFGHLAASITLYLCAGAVIKWAVRL